MTVLANPMDAEQQAQARAEQHDPWVMYFVCPRRPQSSGARLLADATAATLACEARFADDDRHRDAFAQWREQSFRKVALRARPAQFERVSELDHVRHGEIICLPPRRRGSAEAALTVLQAHAGGPLSATDEALAPDPDAMLYLICAELEMTLGKAIAQIAHVVLIARDRYPAALADDRIARWTQRGAPAQVALVDRATFTRARDELLVAAVRDAGLTQVAPGTETVLALAPGLPRPDWLAGQLHAIA